MINPVHLSDAAAYLGAGLCMGLGALGSAVGEGKTAANTAESMARQPGASEDLLKTMLVGQAVAESASIFSLVVAVLLIFGERAGTGVEAMSLFTAGLCMGTGALGPGYGSGLAAKAATLSVGRNPHSHTRVQTTMLVGQAVAQTPAVFALMISFLLIFRQSPLGWGLETLAATLAAGVSVGVGAIGPAIGSGYAASAAVEGVAKNPTHSTTLIRTMLLGQAICQSTAIYALLVSLILLYMV